MSSSNINGRDKRRGKRVIGHAETERNVAVGNSEPQGNQQPLETVKFRSLTEVYGDPNCELSARRRMAYSANANDNAAAAATLGGSIIHQNGIEVTNDGEDSEMDALMVLASHFSIQGNESLMQSSSATRLEHSYCTVERISQLTATTMAYAGEAGPSSSKQPANPSIQTRPKRVIKKPARDITIVTRADEAGPSSSQQPANPSQTRPKRVIKKPARYAS